MRLRRYILAGAAALTIATMGSGPVSAQMAVVDVRAIAQAIQQVRQLQSQLAQLQQTYAAIAHLPQNELNQLASQLNTSQFRNPLGTSGATVSGYANGSGGLAAGAQLNGIYTGNGTDPAAAEMMRSGTSIANTQAMAAQLYQSAATHIQTLQGLEGQLAGATDAKAVADIHARIAMEQASFQGQQIQAQSLATMASNDERNQYQRQDETRRQQLDNQLSQIKAHIQQVGN